MDTLQVVRRPNGAGDFEIVLLAPDGSELVFRSGLFEKTGDTTVETISPDGKIAEKPKGAK